MRARLLRPLGWVVGNGVSATQQQRSLASAARAYLGICIGYLLVVFGLVVL